MITAFSATVATESGTENHYIDYLDSDLGGLRPGEVYQLRIPGRAVSNGATFQLNAVIFADGTKEGSRPHLAYLESGRLGVILETERVKAILESQPLSSGADEGVDAIIALVGSLPSSVEEARSSLGSTRVQGTSLNDMNTADEDTLHAFLEGVRNAREGCQRRLAEVKHAPAISAGAGVMTQSGAASALRQMYGKKSAANRAYCEKVRAEVPK